MKTLKIPAVILMAGILAAGVFGCGSGKATATSASQEYAVTRGNLSLTITAAGNLALSKTEDLAVDIFYPAGIKATIGSVLVDTGDSVKAGQVLVTLDKDEWDEQLSTLQKTLSTAQRTVITKTTLATDAERQLGTLQRAVTTAQRSVATAQRTVELKKMAVTAAELNVQSSNSTLNQIAEVKKAKDVIDEIKLKLRLAGTGDYLYWSSQIPVLQQSLAQAQAYYNDIVTGTGVTSSTDVTLLIAQKYLAVQQAQFALGDAQKAVDDAVTAVDTAQVAVDDASYAAAKQQITLANAKLDLDDAKSTLADTEKKLADARGKSPEIKAPFDGFVTKVNVSGGDEVLNGTVAVTVADPNKFEADILVSEMDIMKVSLNGTASISLNAITGVKLPAKITHIAPTATISSGVVNYAVKVEIDADAASRLQAASPAAPATSNATAQLSEALQRMVDSGRMTQEQAQAMQQRAASGEFSARSGINLPEGFTPPAGAASSGSSGSRAASQLPTSVPQNFQLKQGLTGTVELIVAQRNNVLLVPNGALTRTGNQRTVQVLKADGTKETRTVQIGLSDWQNTEITSGLTEGEKIIVPGAVKSTAAPTTTAQPKPPQGIFFGR